MTIDTNNMISVTEVNQNFSKAMQKADHAGHVVILKRNKPKYMLINIEESPIIEMTDDDIVNAGLGVASGKMNYEDLLFWVMNHKA